MTATRLTLLACVMAIVAACNAPTEDWSDPAWIDMRLEALDPRAFQEFTGLSAEQQAPLVETIVEVYNGGLRQEDALRALVAAGNSGDPSLRQAVARHAASEDPVVAEHARWALDRLPQG